MNWNPREISPKLQIHSCDFFFVVVSSQILWWFFSQSCHNEKFGVTFSEKNPVNSDPVRRKTSRFVLFSKPRKIPLPQKPGTKRTFVGNFDVSLLDCCWDFGLVPLETRKAEKGWALIFSSGILRISTCVFSHGNLHPRSLTARPWKWMVGSLLSFWEGNFWEAMLNFGGVRVTSISSAGGGYGCSGGPWGSAPLRGAVVVERCCVGAGGSEDVGMVLARGWWQDSGFCKPKNQGKHTPWKMNGWNLQIIHEKKGKGSEPNLHYCVPAVNLPKTGEPQKFEESTPLLRNDGNPNWELVAFFFRAKGEWLFGIFETLLYRLLFKGSKKKCMRQKHLWKGLCKVCRYIICLVSYYGESPWNYVSYMFCVDQ